MKDIVFPRNGYPIFSEARELIGNVSSGAFSPNINKFIGSCYLKTEFSTCGRKIFVQIRNHLYEAEVTSFPFLKPRIKKEA